MAGITVEALDHYGSDLTVVNAARVSFNKHHSKLERSDVGLIGYLAQHNHWTPFAHPQATFRISCPIPIARQQFKSTVGFIYSEVSRRYTTDEPEFFIPTGWRSASEDAKQGSGDLLDYQLFPTECYGEACKNGSWAYYDLLGHGVAPEQARLVLPQGMITTFIVTGSLAAWARFCNQRLDEHAQQEVRAIAKLVSNEMLKNYPFSWIELVDLTTPFVTKESPDVISAIIRRGHEQGCYTNPDFSNVSLLFEEDADCHAIVSKWADRHGLDVDYYNLSENMSQEELIAYNHVTHSIADIDYGKIQRQGWVIMMIYHNEDGAWAIRVRPSYIGALVENTIN